MCGIAGIITTTGTDCQQTVRSMSARLRHRGPDDLTEWAGEGASFGHTRLAIIDVDGGAQPFFSEDGRIVAIYNGEIYNFAKLRAELVSRGHRFSTRTDGEVIVHLYEEEGRECLAKLKGMFALALLDTQTGELLLARDRLGQKPLLYLNTPERIVFASELAALLESNPGSFELDPQALDDYLTYGYVPAPRTIYRNVLKLPPAHGLVWRAGSVELFRYWSIEDEKPIEDLTESHAAEALRATLTDAVRARLISDVPLGAFLSGGLDSSIIVGLMASLVDEPVKTFSIGFDEPGYSELSFAREVARMHGTDHTEFVVRPDCISMLPELVRHFGEPFADSSAIPTYCVARQTVEHVKVALSGDGGDELFSGYERYEALRIAGRLHGRAALRFLFGRKFWRRLGRSGDLKSRMVSLRRFATSVAMEDLPRYLSYLQIFGPEQKADIYRPEFVEQLSGHDAEHYLRNVWERFAEDGDSGPRALDLSARAARTDLASYLPGDLLTKVDVTSMANSLEVRSPFLDHELVQLALRIPTRLKRSGVRGKQILRRTFADILPTTVLHRRKMGFAVPMGRWMREQLHGYVEKMLLSNQTRINKYFRPDALREMVAEHVERRTDHTSRLYALLMLELWHREFMG